MGCTLLLNSNYIDPSTYADETASSEQVFFPASNLDNGKRRTRVWRSAGLFEITSSNRTFVFRETALTNLTSGMNVGTYTRDELLVEMALALNVGGASNYTCEIDSATQKFKFTSDGSGGGGIFEFIWSTATDLADLLGFDHTDDTGALTYSSDTLKISEQEWIKWDLGTASNPTAFIAIGNRNESIQLSESAVIKLQGNETDAWTSPSFDQTIPYDERALMVVDADGLHTGALRYWRLYIEDTGNINGYLELGSIFLGEYLNPTRGAVQFPFDAKFIDNSRVSYSESGAGFSDIKQQTESFSLKWLGLTIAEKELFDEFFREVGIGESFFVVLDNSATYSSSQEYYTRYVKFGSEPSYQLQSPGNFTMNMALREEI